MAKFETIRVNFNAPKKLVEDIKKYSEFYGLPYTQCYVLLLKQGLEYQKMISNTEEMIKIYKTEKNNVSDEVN